MKMSLKRSFFIVCTWALLFLVGSCGINSNIMFKSPRGEYASLDSLPLAPKEDYRISKNDKFTFTISTNQGQKVVERMSGLGGQGSSGQQQTQQIQFLVRSNGMTNLPVVGDLYVQGLTVRNLEDTLKRLFSLEYQEPYVQVQLTNQRVLVFPGSGGEARVVPLVNSNTTLMEAIAAAGGVSDRGRAKAIRLMRNVNGERKIYQFDLSTVDGLRYADLIVQANDYIYIEPNPRIGREVIAQTAPFLSIFSSLFVVVTVLKNL